MSSKTAEFWKFSTSALFGVLVTIATGWFGGQFEKISAHEAKEIVGERLETVNVRVTRNSTDIAALTQSVSEMAKLNNELRSDFRALLAELRAKGAAK